ncbi:PAS domain-containing protein [Pelomicrobium sp. G1]|uniref:PAS domain-containing protein n=1 Tax=unclassified Pelomicrobium TaxID=2815318 RepID=UPI003F777EE1
MLTELAPYLVAVIDLSGVIKYVNSVITRVMGYLPAEVIGRPFLEFVQREDVVVKERANRAPG